MENKLQIGQVLFRENRQRGKPTEIEKVTIANIGNKYFYLEGDHRQHKYDKHTLYYYNKTYTQDNDQLYRTEQEILDRWEKNKLSDKLRNYFSYTGSLKNTTLDQLRKVAEILEITNE